VSRRTLRRFVAITATAALTALSVAAPVSAGNTRTIYIGDPGGDIAPDPVTGGELPGSLTYTPTHPGGFSAVDIQVRNDGGQTVNHANLLGGYAADSAPVNLLFPAPAPPSLPAGLTFATTFPGNPPCVIGPDGDGAANRSLNCDLGTLVAHSAVTIRVVIQTGGSDAVFATWFGVYLNEGNSTGSNQDNFYATGSISSATASCEAGKNKDANYFLPGSKVSLATANCTGTGTRGSVASGNALAGQGSLGTLAISGPIADCPTGTGYTCYGDAVEAHVLPGELVPGGLHWSITWYGTRSLSGVVHLWDSYVAGDATHGHDYTIILFKKQSQCGRSLTPNCWLTTDSSKGNESPAWFQATFVTPDNGRSGGMF
jgi:hypothetical protein